MQHRPRVDLLDRHCEQRVIEFLQSSRHFPLTLHDADTGSFCQCNGISGRRHHAKRIASVNDVLSGPIARLKGTAGKSSGEAMEAGGKRRASARNQMENSARVLNLSAAGGLSAARYFHCISSSSRIHKLTHEH
jgi:hypothetical protein